MGLLKEARAGLEKCREKVPERNRNIQILRDEVKRLRAEGGWFNNRLADMYQGAIDKAVSRHAVLLAAETRLAAYENMVESN